VWGGVGKPAESEAKIVGDTEAATRGILPEKWLLESFEIVRTTRETVKTWLAK